MVESLLSLIVVPFRLDLRMDVMLQVQMAPKDK